MESGRLPQSLHLRHTGRENIKLASPADPQGGIWGGKPTLASHKLVRLAQSKVVVDVAVFEQAPQLQTGQLKQAVGGPSAAESAVESIDRPQLSTVLQHCKRHLLGTSRGRQLRPQASKLGAHFTEELHLFVLGVPFPGRDHGQHTLDAQSHVLWTHTGRRHRYDTAQSGLTAFTVGCVGLYHSEG